MAAPPWSGDQPASRTARVHGAPVGSLRRPGVARGPPPWCRSTPPARSNTAPVYPWFGKDIRDGIDLAIENYALLRRLWDEDVVDWDGRFRTPLHGFTAMSRPLDGVPPFVWHGSIRSPEIAEQAAFYGDGFFANHIFWPKLHFAAWSSTTAPASPTTATAPRWRSS